MGSLSNFAENALLGHVVATAYTPVATVYLALYESDPTDADTGTETTYTSYARQAITFAAATARRVTQSGAVNFPQSTGGTSTVTHWGIHDASTAGNLLAHGALGTSREIVSGSTPSVADGEVWAEFTAGEISTFLAHALLDLMFRNVAYAQPDTFVFLTTATIADGDTGATVTEVSGGSYARVQVNKAGGASPAWSAVAAGAADNANAIDFPTATAAWGTVVAAGLMDVVTLGAGNVLFYDNGVVDQAVADGDSVTFPIGDFDLSIT